MVNKVCQFYLLLTLKLLHASLFPLPPLYFRSPTSLGVIQWPLNWSLCPCHPPEWHFWQRKLTMSFTHFKLFRTGGPACLCSLTFHDFPSKFMSLVTWNDLPLLNRPHSLSLPSLCTCYVLCQGQCQPHCFLGLGNPSPSFRMEFRKASLLSPLPTHSSSDPEAPCTYFIIALISLDCNCHLLLCLYL